MFGKLTRRVEELEKFLSKLETCHHCRGLFEKGSMKEVACYYESEKELLYFCNQHTPNYNEILNNWNYDLDKRVIKYQTNIMQKLVKTIKPNYKF